MHYLKRILVLCLVTFATTSCTINDSQEAAAMHNNQICEQLSEQLMNHETTNAPDTLNYSTQTDRARLIQEYRRYGCQPKI